MIRDLNIMHEGAIVARQPEAPGVVAVLAERARKSPWLNLTGAVAEFRAAGMSFSFDVTATRWKYIALRAANEVPDPQSAEMAAEMLWAEGVPATPSLEVGAAFGLHARVRCEVRAEAIWRAEYIMYSLPRSESTVAPAFHSIINGARRALPPDIELRNKPPQPGDTYPCTIARCNGCGEEEAFTYNARHYGAPSTDASSHFRDYVTRSMVGAHGLCGVRHPERNMEAREKRAVVERYQRMTYGVPLLGAVDVGWLHDPTQPAPGSRR